MRIRASLVGFEMKCHTWVGQAFNGVLIILSDETGLVLSKSLIRVVN